MTRHLRSNQGIFWALCVPLMLGACAVRSPLPIDPAPQTIRTRTDTVTVLGRVQVKPARGLLAVIPEWTAADIHHVNLAFYQGATLVGTLTVSQANLGEVVQVSNLKANTSYSIRATAWQDAGETVQIDNYASNAASCTTNFTTTADTLLTLTGGIALQLASRAFSAQLASGLSITGVGGNPWTTADIHHVNLDLYRDATLASSLVVNSANLGEVLVFDNLKANSSYSVRASAWQDAGETVQIDNYATDAASCTTSFSTTNDTVVSIVGGILLALRDRILNGIVTTLAGSTAGYADGTGAAAQFNGPYGVAVDTAGNVYVAEAGNHRIRKISPAGVVTTLAGSGVPGYADGTGTAASFSGPAGIAVDVSGNVYVSDLNNERIRKISPAGVVTTFAGSGSAGLVDAAGTTAKFDTPEGLAVDGAGNIYVADAGNSAIRKITPAGVVTTVAGGWPGYVDGSAGSAQFNAPRGVAVDGAGNIYVADTTNGRIRKISNAGTVTTLAGSGSYGYVQDGTGTAAAFNVPTGITIDGAGNLYVTDDRIRKVSPAGVVTTVAGDLPGFADGTGSAAQFNGPIGIAADGAGRLYVADGGNHRIRKIQ